MQNIKIMKKIIISITLFCLFAFNVSEGQTYALTKRKAKHFFLPIILETTI